MPDEIDLSKWGLDDDGDEFGIPKSKPKEEDEPSFRGLTEQEKDRSGLTYKKYDNTARKQARGGVLKTIRKRKGWSQYEMANYLGTSQQHYQRIESGKESPTTKMMDFWLYKLDVGILTIAL